MAAERFRCPNCNTLLVKSDVDQVLAEAGGFISFGSPTQTCPACRSQIDRKSIIAGTYDEKPSGWGVWLFLAAVAAIVIWMFAA